MELIGSKRAAAICGVSRIVFNRWVRAEKVKPVMQMEGDTGAYLFDLAVIEELAAQRKAAKAAREEAKA